MSDAAILEGYSAVDTGVTWECPVAERHLHRPVTEGLPGLVEQVDADVVKAHLVV